MATPSQPGSIRTLEMAHVLFTDIVAYSRFPMDQQHEALQHLQEAVRETKEYARAKASDQLIRLPTGDGMALVFLGDVEAPVRCALELHRILRRRGIIPMNHSNNGRTSSAESEEGRLRLNENALSFDTYPTPSGTARVPQVRECAGTQ
jgi:hypothetical protein